jgi:hypothetical protein
MRKTTGETAGTGSMAAGVVTRPLSLKSVREWVIAVLVRPSVHLEPFSFERTAHVTAKRPLL